MKCGLFMINNQEYITTELKRTLEKMIHLSLKRLNNLIVIIIGIIVPLKYKAKYFYNIKLTAQNYICNMVVCKAIDAEDIWFIVNNLDSSLAIREYKKRFQIEEMFKDFKSGGFNLESTWNMNIHYIRIPYLCVCIAYCWIITLGVSFKFMQNNCL